MTDKERPPMEPLLDTMAAARLLGVSRRTLESWVRLKRIPHVKLGTGRNAPTRFRPESLREWVADKERQPERP